MEVTRPRAFAFMVLGYVVGLIALVTLGSAESAAALAAAGAMVLLCYAYAWFVRGSR